jgi:hypothetical protein
MIKTVKKYTLRLLAISLFGCTVTTPMHGAWVSSLFNHARTYAQNMYKSASQAASNYVTSFQKDLELGDDSNYSLANDHHDCAASSDYSQEFESQELPQHHTSATFSPSHSQNMQTAHSRSPISSNKVRVYHRISRGGSLTSVRQHGLLSYNELFKRGLSREKPCARGLFFGHYDVIYAAWAPRPITDFNSVGIDVDPTTTYVYNCEFRSDLNLGSYKRSKVLLATYIKNRIKAEEMRKNAVRGQVVIFDPYTSEPFYVSSDDKRHYDERERLSFGFGDLKSHHYMYLNEVIFDRDCIEPEELIIPHPNSRL